MGKIIETKITRFDGGIATDPRDRKENKARMISNFDALTNSKKLTPRRDLETADSSASTSRKRNFALGVPDIGNDPEIFKLYALGVQSGLDTAEVLRKDISVGVTSTDFDDASWSSPTANQSSAGTVAFECFVYYKSSTTVGRVYLIERNSGTGPPYNRIGSFDPQGTAWSSAEGTLAVNATNLAQGLVHSKDDILYIPYENYIASKDGTNAFSMSALILPRDYYITSICEYGNYLAIACAPRNGFSNSRLYLWDRNSALSTIDDSIDLGSGVVKILEEVDGDLIAVSLKADAINASNQEVVFDERVIFRIYSGGKMLKFMELKAESTSTRLPIAKYKIDNRLYFLMGIDFNGSEVEGLWSVGRTSLGGPMALFHEYTSALNDSTLHNFTLVGDFFFFAHQNSSGTFLVTKTADTASYSNNSIYESLIFDGGDSSLMKHLLGVTAMTAPMPTDGQIIMQYKVDAETSWTTIFTSTTNNAISFSAVKAGGNFPSEYKEIQFRLVSTGGAEITGFSFREEIIGKRPY